MMTNIAGLHHVTAVAIDPQANIEFCTKVLGLRKTRSRRQSISTIQAPITSTTATMRDGRARSLRSFPSS